MGNQLRWRTLTRMDLLQMEWNDIQSSLSSLTKPKKIIENDNKETKLFDHWQSVKEIVSENVTEWNKRQKHLSKKGGRNSYQTQKP